MVDRDLLSAVTAAGGIALVIEGTRRRRDWDQLGASAVLPASFDERQLLTAIEPQAQQATPAPQASPPPPPPQTPPVSQTPPPPQTPQATPTSQSRSIAPRDAPQVPAQAARSLAPLIAVTGPGGTGASVVAIALAQGLAAARRRVLLVDACLNAEQSMLHNAHGAQPGLTEMVDLHSAGAPSVRQVRQLAIGIVERGYHLLVGLRRARHWSSLRPASLQVTLHSLRAAFDMVVADVDAEVDGEAQTGSVEIEERNGLARTVVAGADLVLVVGQPNMKGVYALVRTVIDLLEFGVAPQRLLPVINQASGDATTRAELSRAVRQLISDAAGGPAVSPALFLPDVSLENELRDRDAFPRALPHALATATDALLSRHGVAGTRDASEPRRITPGALGHWSGKQP